MTRISPVFELLSAEMHARSGLSQIEARGTLRLALKQAGLTPETVMRRPIAIVVRRVLPQMLTQRGIGDAAALCLALGDWIETASVAEPAGSDSPEEVFRRIGK